MGHKKYLLGLDLGSSSIKASLVAAESGDVVASCFKPENEMRISSPQPDWAEQDPAMWWKYAVEAIRNLLHDIPDAAGEIESIGISYQMHGLVLLDESGEPLRPAIIWCDSRAVETGADMEQSLGRKFCLTHMLNAPGNFTAAKLAWVKENEPELFSRTDTAMLPGDYLAFRLTGEKYTTHSGLSEGVLYDFTTAGRSPEVTGLLGSDPFAPVVPSFGEQGRLTHAAQEETGIHAGTPVNYRAGDQPNNALSLKVSEPGQVAATAGTSGVIYAVSDQLIRDDSSRINTFLHPSPQGELRTGILLCINGTGIANRWIREMTGGRSYEQMNALAAGAAAGSDGLHFFPFGNGAERMLGNRQVNASFTGLSFTRHGQNELYRAVQEGIVFSFVYGFDLLKELGSTAETIRVPQANMFLSPLFCQLFTSLTGCLLEIYQTDGARGAALAAGTGAGLYGGIAQIPLSKSLEYSPDHSVQEIYRDIYESWKNNLSNQLKK